MTLNSGTRNLNTFASELKVLAKIFTTTIGRQVAVDLGSEGIAKFLGLYETEVVDVFEVEYVGLSIPDRREGNGPLGVLLLSPGAEVGETRGEVLLKHRRRLLAEVSVRDASERAEGAAVVIDTREEAGVALANLEPKGGKLVGTATSELLDDLLDWLLESS